MEPNSDRKLLMREASLAMRTAEYSRAAELYAALEKLEPENSTWPSRCADAFHEMGDADRELAARIRTADLHVGAGRVIEAIASCKLILTLDPRHRDTEERLHLLYTEAGNDLSAGETPEVVALPGGPPDTEAADIDDRTPFDELLLTQVMPGAQPSAGHGDPPESVHEIPIDDPNERSHHLIDLDLEEIELTDRAVADLTDTAVRRQPDASSPLEQLGRTPLFGSLDSKTIRRLMGLVRLVELRENEVVFHEGDPSDALYVVAEGAVVPIAEGKRRLGVLEAGDFFGEIGLVTDQPRSATVKALVDTRLLALDRAVMWKLMRRRPEVFKVMLRFLRERWIDRTTRTSPFFAAIARAEREAVGKQFDFLEVADASVVIEQDRPAENLYVLLAGAMQLVRIGIEGDKVLGSLEPGDLFGELSMLRGEPAKAAVVATGKCWVLALPRRRFERILAQNPKLEKVIAAMARSRAKRNQSLETDLI